MKAKLLIEIGKRCSCGLWDKGTEVTYLGLKERPTSRMHKEEKQYFIETEFIIITPDGYTHVVPWNAIKFLSLLEEFPCPNAPSTGHPTPIQQV